MSEAFRKDTPVSGRTAVLERDWTKGNTFRNLLSLSWPMMVTEGLYILGIIVAALAFTLYFLLGRWKRKRI
jgi:hypothetical protein